MKPARNHSAKPRVIVVRPHIGEVADEAVAALLADESVRPYQRAGLLVRIDRADASQRRRRGRRRLDGSPFIAPVGLANLRERLARAARWVRLDDRGQAHDALPPEWMPRTLAERGAWPFPTLAGVVEIPSSRLDGSLLDVPGYDDASGLVYMPSCEFPPIPSAPTIDDARAALEILRQPFRDFPYLEDCDRAANIAALLTPIARSAVAGPVPLAAYRATAPGTGKGLNVDVISIVATGRRAPCMAADRGNDEMRKMLLAVAVEGAGIVLFDNIDGRFGSAALAMALTSEEIEDRILGYTRRVRGSLRTTSWFCTGNGTTFSGDMGRRVMPIDLDAGVEHPEDRDDFVIENLREWTSDNRSRLVVAALTLLRAYDCAGRPRHGLPRMGSFEEWDDLVRGACVWSGCGDPLAGRDRIRLESDSDLDALRAAIGAWTSKFGTAPRTVVAAIEETKLDAGSRSAFAALAQCGEEKLDATRLGYALRRVRGRIADGRKFDHADDETGGKCRWRVAEAERPTVPESRPDCPKCGTPLPPDRDSCEICAVADREAVETLS